MPQSDAPTVFERLERYYDAIPRAGARTEAVGPFTLFLATGGFPFYARPQLGLTEAIEPRAVTMLLARQRELGVPEAIEWVVETTPSLSVAARTAGLHVMEVPLLVLEHPVPVLRPAEVRVRRITPDEPDLDRILAVAAVAFANPGTATGPAGRVERDAIAATGTADRSRFRERVATGEMVLVVAEDRDGPIASGSHRPVDGVTEIVGVATLPSARRRGIGAAVTDALVQDALASRLEVVFLSADGDDVARIYGRLGFRRVGSAGIAEAGGP